jgi:uncharacterized protein
LKSLFERFPEMRNLRVPSFGTWLHYAAAHGGREAVEFLIDEGFDPASRGNREHRGPLAEAAVKGRDDIVRLLLALDVPLETDDTVCNPLFGAIIAHSLEVARMLIGAGIDTSPRYRLGSSKKTVDAVAFAMLHGARDIARAIALHNHSGDEAQAEASMAEGLMIAHAITRPAA